MPSATDICNRALSRVGEARITSLTDDSKQARACSSAYAHIRDEVFRAHPWNSVITRAKLAKLFTSKHRCGTSGDGAVRGADAEQHQAADCNPGISGVDELGSEGRRARVFAHAVRGGFLDQREVLRDGKSLDHPIIIQRR